MTHKKPDLPEECVRQPRVTRKRTPGTVLYYIRCATCGVTEHRAQDTKCPQCGSVAEAEVSTIPPVEDMNG